MSNIYLTITKEKKKGSCKQNLGTRNYLRINKLFMISTNPQLTVFTDGHKRQSISYRENKNSTRLTGFQQEFYIALLRLYNDTHETKPYSFHVAMQKV